jgi:hypothetical protein
MESLTGFPLVFSVGWSCYGEHFETFDQQIRTIDMDESGDK